MKAHTRRWDQHRPHAPLEQRTLIAWPQDTPTQELKTLARASLSHGTRPFGVGCRASLWALTVGLCLQLYGAPLVAAAPQATWELLPFQSDGKRVLKAAEAIAPSAGSDLEILFEEQRWTLAQADHAVFISLPCTSGCRFNTDINSKIPAAAAGLKHNKKYLTSYGVVSSGYVRHSTITFL